MKLREDVALADVEFGTALLDERSGEYWNLNPTGAVVLRTLIGGGTVDAAVSELAEEYGVERDLVSADVEGLVAELRSVGLIEA